jgi:hypothetical protein
MPGIVSTVNQLFKNPPFISVVENVSILLLNCKHLEKIVCHEFEFTVLDRCNCFTDIFLRFIPYIRIICIFFVF